MTAKAGTYESCDCRITVTPNHKRIIELESIVFDQFKDDIYHVINTVLDEHKLNNIKIECLDKGALDYTIKSRLITALKRGGYIE